MAAFNAVLDPQYPKSMREVAELLYLALVRNEATTPSQARLQDLVRLVFSQMESLCEVIGGSSCYFPKVGTLKLTSRNLQMCAEFKGNYKDLCRKYKLSDVQVRKIIDGWHKEKQCTDGPKTPCAVEVAAA